MSYCGTSTFEWASDLIFCEYTFSLLWIGTYQLFFFNSASSVGSRPNTSLRYIWGFHYFTKIIHGIAQILIPECHFFNLCIVIVVVRESWFRIQCDLISEKGRESTNKLESSFLQAMYLKPFSDDRRSSTSGVGPPLINDVYFEKLRSNSFPDSHRLRRRPPANRQSLARSSPDLDRSYPVSLLLRFWILDFRPWNRTISPHARAKVLKVAKFVNEGWRWALGCNWR